MGLGTCPTRTQYLYGKELEPSHMFISNDRQTDRQTG